jgi:hypothetical protein
MVRDALLLEETSDDWARKAGATLGESTQQVIPTGAIWGTFSRRNHSELGWVEHHSYQTLAYFPNDEHGMDRYADWSGVNQARLVVNVTKAAQPDSSLNIFGNNVAFGDGLSVPLDSVGLKISDWEDVIVGDASGALTQWVVLAPSNEGPGGSDPPGGLDFMESAPGNLTLEGASYFGDSCVAQTNFGYS